MINSSTSILTAPTLSQFKLEDNQRLHKLSIIADHKITHRPFSNHSQPIKMVMSRYTNLRTIVFALFASCLISRSSAFVISPNNARRDTSLNFFGDAFKKAFDNEDTGPKQNAGLSGVSFASSMFSRIEFYLSMVSLIIVCRSHTNSCSCVAVHRCP
jgi:hypothetical protein